MSLTNADFAERVSYLAAHVATWAGNCLTLREEMNEPMDIGALKRFHNHVLGRLRSLGRSAGMLKSYRHVKRESVHLVLCRGEAQCATGPIQEGDEVEIYLDPDDENGKVWVRRVEEFHDGRFERIEP